eukprot:scpid94165/ scgid23827/ 
MRENREVIFVSTLFFSQVSQEGQGCVVQRHQVGSVSLQDNTKSVVHVLGADIEPLRMNAQPETHAVPVSKGWCEFVGVSLRSDFPFCLHLYTGQEGQQRHSTTLAALMMPSKPETAMTAIFHAENRGSQHRQ